MIALGEGAVLVGVRYVWRCYSSKVSLMEGIELPVNDGYNWCYATRRTRSGSDIGGDPPWQVLRVPLLFSKRNDGGRFVMRSGHNDVR